MGDDIIEKDIPWSNWRSIWKIGFDMECDGTRDYVNKMFRPSKIDQVLNFYGIPHIYKNEYKKYLKYRIQPRHCGIVNDYFLISLRQDWYDVSDFDYKKLQDEYNQRVPEPEQTGLDLHVNYDLFLKKDQEHRAAILKQSDSKKDEQIEDMQKAMQQMQKDMALLIGLVWKPNVLLSKDIPNDWTSPSWSDSTRNATNWIEETPPKEDGNTWTTWNESTIDSKWSEEIQWTSSWTEWSELIWSEEAIDDGFNKWWIEPFKIWGEEPTKTEPGTKDWRTA